MTEKKDFISSRKKVTLVDLFAGAGGISEGFLQAYTDDKYFDFLLASDINPNCELTHRIRYNMQLGLDMEFICQDIMEDDFVDNLLAKIGNKQVDVVTGGPSCHKRNRVHKVCHQVNTELRQLARRLNISGEVTTYCARHSFATVLKKSGVNIGIISEALGHHSLKTTQIYLGAFENS